MKTVKAEPRTLYCGDCDWSAPCEPNAVELTVALHRIECPKTGRTIKIARAS